MSNTKYELIIIWSDEDSCFIARFPELDGCSTHGNTRVEAATNAEQALDLYVESLLERGIKLPPKDGSNV